jgi:hypothetical protein
LPPGAPRLFAQKCQYIIPLPCFSVCRLDCPLFDTPKAPKLIRSLAKLAGLPKPLTSVACVEIGMGEPTRVLPFRVMIFDRVKLSKMAMRSGGENVVLSMSSRKLNDWKSGVETLIS